MSDINIDSLQMHNFKTCFLRLFICQKTLEEHVSYNQTWEEFEF